MNIYTKKGDQGKTSLIRMQNISKSDERIELVGTIDELTSHIGVGKSLCKDAAIRQKLSHIQETLILVMAGVADPYNGEYKCKPEETGFLEKEIDAMEASFDRPHQFVLPGGSRVSAEIDVARTVTRRAERVLTAVRGRYGADPEAGKYLNRLADYLYVLARYLDALEETDPQEDLPEEAGGEAPRQMNLFLAKRLIRLSEKEAEKRGMQVVTAVCSAQGNPVAVHSMDGALLVSFDAAMKKAYSAAAVQMSTQELGSLAQPGGTFYGLDKLQGGGIVIVGGGVPVRIHGQLIGGLGISGATGEEDHRLASAVLEQFAADKEKR